MCPQKGEKEKMATRREKETKERLDQQERNKRMRSDKKEENVGLFEMERLEDERS